MGSVHPDAQRAVITRVTEGHWRAVADDREIGRGDASRRPDGRIFVSVDAWHGAVFDRLTEAMLAELPRPLHTMVDGTDHDTTARWERAGMAVRRREWLYQVSTGFRPDMVPVPAEVTLLPVGAAEEGPLEEAYSAIRAEIEATVGWAAMPVEVPPQPAGAPMDPSRYAVAAGPDRYEGLVRVVADVTGRWGEVPGAFLWVVIVVSRRATASRAATRPEPSIIAGRRRMRPNDERPARPHGRSGRFACSGWR